MSNIVDTKEYKDKMKEREQYFVDDNLLRVENFNFKEYTLSVGKYHTGAGSWDFTRGLLTDGNGDTIADIKRNYGSFWHAFLTHPNGHDYLLCGEDYQGYTIVDITEKTIHSYIGDESLKGCGFCIVDFVDYDHTIDQITVEGCYWGAPFEYVVYNFKDPTILPLAILDTWPVDSKEDSDE